MESNDKLIQKAYQTRRNIQMRIRNRSSYADCKLSDEWEDKDRFLKWFKNNYKEGWQLDKDLMVKNNKIYGAKECVYIPEELNKMFSSNPKGKYLQGVSKTNCGRFDSSIMERGKTKYLGTFTSEEDAHKRAMQARLNYQYNTVLKYHNDTLYPRESHNRFRMLIDILIERIKSDAEKLK